MGVGAVYPRGAGLALAERVGVIEIDLPDGVRVQISITGDAPLVVIGTERKARGEAT
jgi:hypothetical protein